MAPRKGKVSTKPQLLNETPVVFFLKIADDKISNIIPAGDENRYSELDPVNGLDVISYSSILNSVELSNKHSKFNTELLKSVLDKVSLEKYSSQTACFWCCHTFGWTPAILPLSYDAYKNLFTCEGNFCSPECALAYNYADITTSDSLKWNRHALLGNIYSDLYSNRTISPAPPRTTLRIFGGPLDIDQYREYLSGDNDIVLSQLPPVRLQFPTMNVQGPLRDIKKYVSLSTDVVEKATEQLRLKRLNPVNTNTQTLDMCIIGKNR
jgi:hypothetical protein